MKRFGVAVAAVFLLAGLAAGPAAGASPASVFTDKVTFTDTTGATPITWPANAATALPSKPFGVILQDYSCAMPTLTVGGGAVSVTNPTGNWICFIGSGWNAGLTNINPTPIGPTIVGNGEDDYSVVLTFSQPQYAVGFGLLTNSSASETVTLFFSDGTTQVFADALLGTASNSFEFVGFKSTTPITKVELNTTGGASQNEGITGIWTSPLRATIASDCTADEVFVSSVGTGPTTPVQTVALMADEQYLITARGTFFAGGDFTYDIQADAEYSQDAYQRANNLPWTDSVRNYGSYGEQLLELLVGVGGAPAPVEWGDFNPSHTYTIQRTGTGTPAQFALKIYDIYANNNAGGLCVSVNGIPVADPNGPYSVHVGATVSFDGSASYDPDGDSITYAWTAAGGTLTGADTVSPTFTAGTAPGTYSVTLTVTDAHGAVSAVATTNVVVTNSAPVADPNGPYLVSVNGTVSFDGSASYDPDGDSITYAWTAAGGTLTGASTVSPTFTAGTAPGIYSVTLTVTDAHGAASTPVDTTVVVYDPVGGFVTGGGWIMSPAGAYKANLTLEGKATFGFVSKYKKGASVPDGNTEFQFKAGDLNFHSTSYDWLVVNKNGMNAQFKGTGTINGAGAYGFMIWATDNTPDTFRISILDTNANDAVVYDNGVNQALGGGSIVVHVK